MDTYVLKNRNFVSATELKKEAAENPEIKIVNRFRCLETYLYIWACSTIVLFALFFVSLGALYALNFMELVESVPEPIEATLNALTFNTKTKLASTSQCNLFEVNTCSMNQIDVKIKEQLNLV